MSMIPEAVYKTIDSRLKDRNQMIGRAEEELAKAEEDAFCLKSHQLSADKVQGGKRKKDAVEMAAIRIAEAKNKLEIAWKWEELFRKMDRIFPFESTSEGTVAGYIYQYGMSQADVCRVTGCDRQTVRARKDRYINRAALLAAQMGLIGEEVIVSDDD